jgi:DNA polymerase I-like protein with 3'-5' exonuclease and polymerase domains
MGMGDLSFPFNFSWKDVRSLLYNEAGVKIKKKTLKDCAFKDIAEICNMHSIGAYKIYQKIEKENEAYKLDRAVLPIVLDMQRRGIRLDKELLIKRNREYKDMFSYGV